MANESSDSSSSLDLIDQLNKPGLTHKEMLAIYDNWSDYDKYSETIAYRDLELAAQAIVKHFPGNRNAYILDIGAGTGLLAQELKKAGLTNIDAVDPSQGLMQIAKGKNLYGKYFNMFFTDNMECIETSTYDAVVAVGAIGEAHVGVNTLPEMIRCAKPGGLVVIALSEEDLNDPECKGKLEPYIERLQLDGLWKCVEKTFVPDYCSDYPGYLFVMKITKTL